MSVVGPRAMPLGEFLSWSQDDQDAQLVWQAREAARCPGCGRHPDDGPQHHHVVVCPSCVDRDRVAKQAAEIPGAHVIPVAGARATCPTCLQDARDAMSDRQARAAAKRGR